MIQAQLERREKWLLTPISASRLTNESREKHNGNEPLKPSLNNNNIAVCYVEYNVGLFEFWSILFGKMLEMGYSVKCNRTSSLLGGEIDIIATGILRFDRESIWN